MIDFGTNEEFIKRYKELKSSRKMAEFYKCNKTSVLNHAKKIGYDVSTNKEIKIRNIPAKEIYKEYLELGSCEKVAKKYNCSNTAIRNYLNDSGYSLNPNLGKLYNVSKAEFIKKYNELKSSSKMGMFYKCSPTTILNYANKINYNPNLNKIYKLSLKDKQYIIDSYQLKTSTELAKQFGVSRGMITKIWYDNNLLGKINKDIRTTEINLLNQKFGKWTVLEKTAERTADGGIYWLCRCECGVLRKVSSLSLRQGTSLSCGAHSNISRGNEKIKQILINANIPFVLEKKFKDCKDKKELPFDFYVDNKYLIEYDGIQHYDKESIYDYEYTHNHDLIKNEWCKKNNIPLIRIPYWHFKEIELKDLILETSDFIENNNADNKSSKIGEIFQ